MDTRFFEHIGSEFSRGEDMSGVRTTKRYAKFVILVLVLLAVLSAESQADLYTYGFRAITSNSAIDPGIGEAQLSVDISGDPGGSQVLFAFKNSGPEASVITEVYFDDENALLQILPNPADSIIGAPGVKFELGDPKPPNLPSGNNLDPSFVARAAVSADAVSPGPTNGVGPGESLGLLFNVGSGSDFGDVVEAINLGFTGVDSLRIGLHVTAFEDGKSESFVATPLPGAVLLGIIGLGVVGVKLRKFA